MDTVRIKSTHPPSQGPFVVINADTFDPTKHELWGEEAQGAPVAAVSPAPAPVTPEPVSAAPEPLVRSTAELRAEYQRITGKRPFMGWSAKALRDKIAEAKST